MEKFFCKTKYLQILQNFFTFAAVFNASVVELVDTPDLKSCDLRIVRVQVPPEVQKHKRLTEYKSQAFF